MAMRRPYRQIGEALRYFTAEGAGWMIIVALTYAPWAYGTTNARTIRGLNWILVAAAAFWCLNLFLRLRHRRQSDRPLLPGILVIVASTILLLGWWMAANAHW